MELTPKQQALERIKTAEQILLLTHKQPDGDALGSLLALTFALRKLGKTVTPVCVDPLPASFAFLPGTEALAVEPPRRGECVISIDTADIGEVKLGYKKDDAQHRVMIVMSPTRGHLRQEDIHFESSGYDVDLIIALDCNSSDRFGDIYNQHTPLFYETPLINIDHHADNEQFGTVNWVDVTATSTAEILVSLLEALGRDTSLFDADIATNLLTGIITDTGSFQNMNTTPKSLTVAAQLVAGGARQQEIIHHIYKIKPVSTLKLWGKALANVKQDAELRMLWATLSKYDFAEVGADPTETKGLIDSLLKTAEGVAFVALLTERDDAVHISFRSVDKGIPVSDIAKLLGGGGHEAAAGAEIEESLSVVEERVIEAVRTFWDRRRSS